MDTQPLLRDFISGDGLLLKREEKKLELWREDDHIPNGRFSDTNNKLDVEVRVSDIEISFWMIPGQRFELVWS